MLMAVSLTPSSIHLLAFLHFSLSAVWVLCFCVLHRRVPVPLRFYIVWIPRRVWLRTCGAAVSWALAVVLGSCSCAYIPFFPPFLPCSLYLPVSSVLLSSRALGPHLHCTAVLYFCNHAIYSSAVFGFVLSCFRGALAGVSGS